MPSASSARCSRAGRRRRPPAPRRTGDAQVGVPPERDRHRAVAGRNERGVDHEAIVVRGDRDLEQVRERERGRVDDRRGGEARDVAPARWSPSPPSRASRRAGRGSATRCRRCGAAGGADRRRRPRRGTGATPGGSPTAPATGGRRCGRPAARPPHREARGARGRRVATTRRSCRRRAGTWRGARPRAARAQARRGTAARRRAPSARGPDQLQVLDQAQPGRVRAARCRA